MCDRANVKYLVNFCTAKWNIFRATCEMYKRLTHCNNKKVRKCTGIVSPCYAITYLILLCKSTSYTNNAFIITQSLKSNVSSIKELVYLKETRYVEIQNYKVIAVPALSTMGVNYGQRLRLSLIHI